LELLARRGCIFIKTLIIFAYDFTLKLPNDTKNWYCYLASEWADSQVDIYNSDLWEKAPKFQWWIEDAINDF